MRRSITTAYHHPLRLDQGRKTTGAGPPRPLEPLPPPGNYEPPRLGPYARRRVASFVSQTPPGEGRRCLLGADRNLGRGLLSAQNLNHGLGLFSVRQPFATSPQPIGRGQ
jgi:hypothetical protein